MRYALLMYADPDRTTAMTAHELDHDRVDLEAGGN
jgi:hypothetical protein